MLNDPTISIPIGSKKIFFIPLSENTLPFITQNQLV